MKTRLITLVIVAVAAITGGGVLTSVASAANCTTGTEAMTRAVSGGYQVIRYGMSLSACTDVDQIRFNYTDTGAQDYTDGTLHQFYINGNTHDVTIGGITEGGGGGILGPGIAQTCWYGSGVMHSLRPFWHFQIHGRSSGQWGIEHFVLANNVGGGPYGITC